MSYNDQFEMARLPIKPLAYEQRAKSQCNEFMIDYGDNGTYHMYIVHHTDKNTYIDLSNMIIKEIADGVSVNGDDITITIEGVTDPQDLGDLLNKIWKNYLFPENSLGFNPSTDMDKLLGSNIVSILLTDNSGTIYLPITSASNVYDSSGKSIQERLDDMTKMAWSVDYIYATTQNQTSFEFTYPFENYSDFMEIRIGTTYVDKTRYQITQEVAEDGNVYGGTITFINETIEEGRRIDLLFMFNALVITDGEYEYTSGSLIANNTITTAKLEKTSDSYTLNDSTSVATSAALYNLYTDLTDTMSDMTNCGWYLDTSTDSTTIELGTIDDNIPGSDFWQLNVITKCAKTSGTTISFTYNGTNYTYTLYGLDGNEAGSLPGNKRIKIIWKSSTATMYVITASESSLTETRKFYRAADQEYKISYNGLDYSSDSIIHVYRNGVRLFEDLDYSIDKTSETITLYVRTEDTEMITFEAISIS